VTADGSPRGYPRRMEIEESCRRDVVARLRRIEGQVAGIVAMIESGLRDMGVER